MLTATRAAFLLPLLAGFLAGCSSESPGPEPQTDFYRSCEGELESFHVPCSGFSVQENLERQAPGDWRCQDSLDTEYNGQFRLMRSPGGEVGLEASLPTNRTPMEGTVVVSGSGGDGRSFFVRAEKDFFVEVGEWGEGTISFDVFLYQFNTVIEPALQVSSSTITLRRMDRYDWYTWQLEPADGTDPFYFHPMWLSRSGTPDLLVGTSRWVDGERTFEVQVIQTAGASFTLDVPAPGLPLPPLQDNC